MPGVERATVIDTILLGRVRRGSPLQPVGGPADSAIGELIPISSGYFDIAGLQAIAGRLPSDAEIDDGRRVAVVSERTAREYWPGRSAVGQILSSKRGALTVIGVVRDARFRALDLESQGEIYAPIALGLWTSTAANFLIRSPLPEERVLPGVIEAVRRYDRASTIRRAQLVSAALAESIRRRRFHAWLFGVLAASGLLIAGAGIFGVVAGATARRTREMGVRLALGSTRDRLIRLLVREQLTPVVAGVLAGGIAAAWAARYVTSMLYGVSAYDGRVWAAAAAIVIGVALAGALLPALRASRVDPVVALRAE